MKNTLSLILFFVLVQCSSGLNEVRGQSLTTLLDTLDVTIANYDRYASQKESRILSLRRQLAQKQLPADRYAVQTLLYDEYHVYDADSALSICDRQLRIATQMDNADWQSEWHVKRSFVLAATGLLDEAERELESVEARSHLLPSVIRAEYFRQRIYLYSHMQQYLGSAAAGSQAARSKNERADILQGLYNDSVLLIVPRRDPLYLWQMAWGYEVGSREIRAIKAQLEHAIENSDMNNRFDAMNAYSLAHIYNMEGDTENYLAALVKSAIADVRCCNHDIASLEELARLLFERGDLERPYTYINFCLVNDLAFHNRVRVVSASEVYEQIHRTSVERQRQQHRQIVSIVCVLIALSVVLALVVLQLYARIRRSRREEKALAEANSELQRLNRQLSETMSQADQTNGTLAGVNAKLSEAISELHESNFVKEETIGMAFTLCSNYITRMEEQRKTLSRLVKTNQMELLNSHLSSSQSTALLKEFFQHFDQLFLNIYPDFIDDFNALLRPEERLHPKEHELLSTELRIYALVRLGINDSVKISEFLHCSPQTVYNHRLRVRNKSDIPNSEFAATVQKLGKASF